LPRITVIFLCLFLYTYIRVGDQVEYIHFKSERNLFIFCEHLYQWKKKIHLYWQHSMRNSMKVQLNEDLYDSKFLSHILAEMYIADELELVLEVTIQSSYMIDQASDLKKIIEESLHLFDEPYFYRKLFGKSFQSYLKELLYIRLERDKELIYEHVIYDVSVTLKEKCIEIIGYAIDDIQFQKEHDAYIERLRRFLKKVEVYSRLIHIYFAKDGIYYYDETGQAITLDDIAQLKEKYPLYLFNLDEHEEVISSLLVLSPQEIILYGEEAYGEELSLVKDIFQERAIVLPSYMFPFKENKLHKHE